MAVRGGTVRAYRQAIGRVATIPGATEHTYRAALGEFLVVEVLESADRIALGADLDAALAEVLAGPLAFGGGA